VRVLALPLVITKSKGILCLGSTTTRTKFPCWPKTAKEYRKTAKEIVIGGQPSSMNRQGWMARKIEFPWRLALKEVFLDCQPSRKIWTYTRLIKRQENESAVKEIRFLGVTNCQGNMSKKIQKSQNPATTEF